MSEELADGIFLHPGDCLDVLATLPADNFDSCVCDPPYGLEFMGKDWDGADGFRRSLNKADVGRDNAFGRTSARAPEYRAGHLFQEWCDAWAREVLRVLKPGAHLVAFGGTRTFHRLACAIEDAGFEVRDQIAWCYGQGFPKSLDVAKAIDKAGRGVPQGGADPTSPHHGKFKGGCSDENKAGRGFGAGPGQFMRESGDRVERDLDGPAAQWDGWGTALKPAWEPIVLARKPLSEGTVAANVLRLGTGAINIDGCRVEGEKSQPGRWPSNLIHDGSEEVLAAFPDSDGAMGAVRGTEKPKVGTAVFGDYGNRPAQDVRGNSGSAARFFYTAKADLDDRLGSRHPTIKPVDLMQWLCRLVTLPGGLVLNPFAGTGTTGEAAWREGMHCVLIEREAEYQDDIRRRMALMMTSTAERRRQAHKEKQKRKPLDDQGTLFA